MVAVGVHEAKTNLSALREIVGSGVAVVGVGVMMLLCLSNRRWWARVVGSEPVVVSGSEVVVVVSA